MKPLRDQLDRALERQPEDLEASEAAPKAPPRVNATSDVYDGAEGEPDPFEQNVVDPKRAADHPPAV